MALHSNFQFEDFPTPYLSTHLPREADVIIIGGGLAGLLTLYYLTLDSKLNVYLLEEGALGFHASGRDIGSINLFDSFFLKKLLESPDKYVDQISMFKSSLDLLNQLIKQEDIQCEYQKAGGVYLGQDDKEYGTLRSLHDLLEKKLPKTIWSRTLDTAETTLLTGSSYFKGGLFVASDAVYSPSKLIHGLANLCQRNDRKVLTNAIVENVTQTQDGVNIHVRNRGVITTKCVVYCTGVYTGKVVPGVNKYLLTHKQHIIATQRLDPKLLARLPQSGMVFNGVRIRATQDRVLIQNAPSTINERLYDGEINIRACENLRKLLKLFYPEIGRAEIEYVWSTISCSGIDGLPISGGILNRPNEYVNIGFGSSNLNAIMLASHMIKDMIVGKPASEQLKQLFDPRRINNV
jgi:glycine/D-amino acid oxidase-like deaminating enzyme